MFNHEKVNVMKINVIRIAMLVFAATLMVSCKNTIRNGSYLKDYKFEVQPDGSVNYTIEGGSYKRLRMVYLVPISKERIIDSAVVWPISGMYKFEGTLPRQGVYIVLSDTAGYKYSNAFHMATIKLFNDSFTMVSEMDRLWEVCKGDIEGAPSGAVYVYHVSDTVNPVYACKAHGGFTVSRPFWMGSGYYSIRYKSEGRLIYAADSIYLCDSSLVNLYGKYKGN